MNGQGSNGFAALDIDPAYEPHVNGDLVDQWLLNEANYPQEQWGEAAGMSWEGWDDFVKDFQMQGGEQAPTIGGGMPMVGGVTNRW